MLMQRHMDSDFLNKIKIRNRNLHVDPFKIEFIQFDANNEILLHGCNNFFLANMLVDPNKSA